MQQSGHRVQIDVKFVAPLKGARKKYYLFTAIDDCTPMRVLRILRGWSRPDAGGPDPLAS
jgi:hypothetical protein